MTDAGDAPRWSGRLVREGDAYVGWLRDLDGFRIDLRGAVVEVDGRKQFELTGSDYVPVTLRAPA